MVTVDRPIQDIIDNYQTQTKLYRKMLTYAQEQLEMVRSSEDNQQLKKLLLNRQNLMNELNSLNEEVRKLQNGVMDILGISKFTYSELGGKINDEHFTALKEVVSELVHILDEINKVDVINQSLLRSNSGHKLISSPNFREAADAYNKALLQKKEKS
ncbi:flagellar export chaperone FlgN [Syntrophomonas palmitatica]|uniref:flagellar export chaperone FlgN n=1 Tax=Syntrophomonas palmitatica TaxID=402877 RepID=UPI0006CF8EC3|nr:flagellar export chaperone FlgN [Syntrophomonas palmitatica]